jgi:hypothetical protein
MENKIICESCSMPLKKQEDHGTNTNGSYNVNYCKFCFKNGKFLDEGITFEEKIEKLVKIGINELGMKEEQARTMANLRLKDLKRWKKD